MIAGVSLFLNAIHLNSDTSNNEFQEDCFGQAEKSLTKFPVQEYA